MVQPLLLTIKFSTSGPEFEEDPTAPELKCDASDDEWYLEIPEVRLNAQLNAIVKLDPTEPRNSLFKMTSNGKQVVLEPGVKPYWLTG